ncbi:TadE/TadG family type IV pilus assembly protein [Nocardioides jiangxiensis]|uniref:TadE/TadG family type IV pilus assembly protein n=1 Tax=Nocardioides jiangxiensis TaxID=3064524 RepID=A0ABT9B828_9ACTN|nr:TadE/TadG family type IV pilus assembly protein [Nocardioides sp. WY-20]MDO7869298.1 TadE/TadG family type IV pilus assembly protein [Nocardioides sp. WY-20]
MAGREEEGAAAVEFALVLPLLLTLVFALIDFGVLFGQTLALNNAAREAARQGAVPGLTCAQVKATGQSSATSIGMTGSAVTPTVSPCPSGEVCSGSVPGQALTVTLTYTHQWLVPIPVPGVPSTYTIRGHGEFRCEYS